jgi:flavin reductase (DIM6/NTAB) family NADH-FMN oxidoreductase RutF
MLEAILPQASVESLNIAALNVTRLEVTPRDVTMLNVTSLNVATFNITALKEVLSHWASGVAVVTARQMTAVGMMMAGMTVSSFTSVSLTPPRILFCADHKAKTFEAIGKSRAFAVNFLGAEQAEWGMRFAGQGPAVADRFEGIATFTAETGAPVLAGALTWLDCRLYQAVACGDHTIFIGDVVACGAGEASGDGGPLLYYRREWRQLG